MSINHIMKKEFDSGRDREWHTAIHFCKELQEFLLDYYYCKKRYYDELYSAQSDYGFYNKLNFLINEFLKLDNKMDSLMREVITNQLKKRLQ